MKSVLFILAIGSLFLSGCGEKKEEKEEKAPKNTLACIKEIAAPYSLEPEVKSVRCYFDKSQTILYPDYESELDREWILLKNGEIKIAIDEVASLKRQSCIGDVCVRVRYKKNGAWAASDYFSKKETEK